MKILMCVLLSSSVFLTGCSTLNDSFDCPAPNGGTCKRMDQVYDMVNGHESLKASPQRNPLMIDLKNGAPRGSREGVMRLWIAPYEDTDGNYHQANAVYTVVREERGNNNTSMVEK